MYQTGRINAHIFRLWLGVMLHYLLFGFGVDSVSKARGQSFLLSLFLLKFDKALTGVDIELYLSLYLLHVALNHYGIYFPTMVRGWDFISRVS